MITFKGNFFDKPSNLFLALYLLLCTASFGQSISEKVKLTGTTTASDSLRMEACYFLSFRHYISRDLDSSMHYAKLHEKIARKAKNRKQEATALNVQGVVFSIRGEMDKSDETHQRALQIRTEIEDWVGVGGSKSNLGNNCFTRGKYDCAKLNYAEAVEAYRKSGDAIGEGRATTALGRTMFYLDDHNFAKEVLRKAFELRLRNGDEIGVAATLLVLGQCHATINENTRAIECLKKAENIYERYGRLAELAECQQYLGNIYIETDDLGTAYDVLQKSILNAKASENKFQEAKSTMDLGTVFYRRSDFSKANEWYSSAALLFDEVGNTSLQGSCMLNSGNALADQKNSSAALKKFEEALSIAEKNKDSVLMAQVFHNRARVYIQQGNRDFLSGNSVSFNSQYQKAIADFLSAEKMFELQSMHSARASSCRNLAEAYLEMDKIDDAIIFLNRAISLRTSTSPFSSERFLLGIQRKIMIRNGQYSKAKELQGELLSLCEKSLRINFDVLSEKEKSTYLKIYLDEIESQGSLMLLTRDSIQDFSSEWLNLHLRFKGILLRSSLGMRRAVYESRNDSLVRAFEDWIKLQEELGSGKFSDQEQEQKKSLVLLLEKSLSKHIGYFNRQAERENMNWESLRKQLKRGDYYLEFVVLNRTHLRGLDMNQQNEIGVFVLSHQKKKPVYISLAREDEVNRILSMARSGDPGSINALYKHGKDGYSPLSALLLKNLLPSLDDAKRIFLSPAGCLHRVSFASLPLPGKMRCGDVAEINYIHSAGTLDLNSDLYLFPSSTFALFGGINYSGKETENEVWKFLPGTKTELTSISSMLSKKGFTHQVYEGDDGGEEKFRSVAVKSAVVHLATHGFFFPEPGQNSALTENDSSIQFRGSAAPVKAWSVFYSEDPMNRSGFALAGANSVWNSQRSEGVVDGVVTAQEVALMDLRAVKLFVLSACETGLGDVDYTEGVYGLQRGLKMAGVKMMLISLWQVPDRETSEFMTRFYSMLVEGKGIKKSFRETQRWMSKKYDPYYWAAFVLVE
jgi:CHAT domain-containing protein/tetratricopeptide (TPR) repeat protein